MQSDEQIEALQGAEQARAEAMKGVERLSGLRDPVAARQFVQTNSAREGEILDAKNEAKLAKAPAYGDSEIAQCRVQQLGIRIARL